MLHSNNSYKLLDKERSKGIEERIAEVITISTSELIFFYFEIYNIFKVCISYVPSCVWIRDLACSHRVAIATLDTNNSVF